MFSITEGRGFQIKFANGYTISVQFGPINYCSNKAKTHAECGSCPNAEVAVWDINGNWVKLDGANDVMGFQTPDDLAIIFSDIAALPAIERKEKGE